MSTKNTSKGSFILYLDQWHALQILNDTQRGRLLRSLFENLIDGTPVDLDDDPALSMAYRFMDIQMSVDRKKWEDIKEKRRKAGHNSAEARKNKKEQKEQVLNSANKKEQNEQVFVSENNHEHNVDVDVDGNVDDDEKEDVDAGGDDACGATTNNITNNNSSYDFWDFYPVLFELGFADPITATQDFVNYYENQNWKLKGGKRIATKEDKIKKAKTWSIKDRWKRNDKEFLSMWAIICNKLKRNNVPDTIWKAAYDERIKVDYNTASSTITIYLPGSLISYLEGNPTCLEILKKFRNDKGFQYIQYMQLNDTSMMKYRLT